MGLYRYTWRTLVRETILLAAAAFVFVPTYFLISLSLKTDSEFFAEPLAFPTDPQLGNYRDAWQGAGDLSLGHALASSLLITCGSVVLLIAIGSICAYTIARRPSRLGTGIYLLFVLGIIIPFQLGVIPTYVMFRRVGLLGSYGSMILLYVGLLMPLTVFLYTGFARVLPREYEEAAQVDGAGLGRTFVRVVFPLLRPVTGTVAVLTGLIIWNDFFIPVIFLGGTRHQTLPVAVYFFVGEFLTRYNIIFAAVAISIVPVLAFYLFAQRQLMRGFSGGIRG